MNVFLEKYFDEFSVTEYEDGYLLHTPIMYKWADHTFSFLIKQTKSGSFTISDRGKTIDFMRENFDPYKFEGKISEVCERFDIRREEDTFIGLLPSFESGQTMRALHNFLGAMHIITNIDIF